MKRLTCLAFALLLLTLPIFAAQSTFSDLGVGFADFKAGFNRFTATEHPAYSLGEMTVTAAEGYDQHSYAFPNGEALIALVGKEGKLLALEYQYPNQSADKAIGISRQFVMANVIVQLFYQGAQTDLLLQQTDEILTLLNVYRPTAENDQSYAAGATLSAVCNGIKLTRQLDAQKTFSRFCVTRAAAGEPNTVTGFAAGEAPAQSAPPAPSKPDPYAHLTGWAKYQAQSRDYYLTGIIPDGWIHISYGFGSDAAWDIANGITILHNGVCYTNPERYEYALLGAHLEEGPLTPSGGASPEDMLNAVIEDREDYDDYE